MFAGVFGSLCVLGLLTVLAGAAGLPGQALSRKSRNLERESEKWPHSPLAFAASEWRLGVQSGRIVPRPAGHRSGPRLSVCSSPARWGRLPPPGSAQDREWCLEVASGLTRRPEDRAKGRRLHRFPSWEFLLRRSRGQQVCQARASWSPHQGKPWGPLPLGPRSWGSCRQPSPVRWWLRQAQKRGCTPDSAQDPLRNFISVDDILSRCGCPWGPDSIT